MIQRDRRKMEVIKMSFKVVSMFSGAGGLDIGFHNKGFQILGLMIFQKMLAIHMIDGQIIMRMGRENLMRNVPLLTVEIFQR